MRPPPPFRGGVFLFLFFLFFVFCLLLPRVPLEALFWRVDIFIWRRAANIVRNQALEGMRGGVCAGRLDKLVLHTLPAPHLLAIPNGVLDFRRPEMNPPT